MRARMILFAPGARRLIERAGKDPRKGLLLAKHTWDDPYKRLAAASLGKGYRLLTPTLGEAVHAADNAQQFRAWWE